jgi:hypothetical protein
MIKVIHDIIADTYTEVELTKEEIAEREAAQADALKETAEREAAQAAKEADKAALLAKLGITADEAKLLLG